jgi:hypothetical protein
MSCSGRGRPQRSLAAELGARLAPLGAVVLLVGASPSWAQTWVGEASRSLVRSRFRDPKGCTKWEYEPSKIGREAVPLCLGLTLTLRPRR